MDKLVVLFTMNGCGFCEMMKTQLSESQIEFVDRNIETHADEYQLFVEATGSEFVPAFMIIDDPYGEPKSEGFVPDKHYNTIEEGIEIIKNKLNG